MNLVSAGAGRPGGGGSEQPAGRCRPDRRAARPVRRPHLAVGGARRRADGRRPAAGGTAPRRRAARGVAAPLGGGAEARQLGLRPRHAQGER